MTSSDLTYGDSLLWREKVPRLAFGNHCVLHLLLAVSALHFAREKPDEWARFEELAENHYTVGLRQVMEILPRQNRDDAGALYIATTLVCAYGFAKTPGPAHLLIVSDGEEVAWFELLKGVRIVVTTMGWDAIFAGVLGPHPSAEADDKQLPSTTETRTRVVEWEKALQRISELVSDSEDGDKQVYRKRIDQLSSTFRSTFGTAANPKYNVHGRMEVVIGYVYSIKDDFVLCLKNKKPLALLILAYLVVLIKTLEWMWYMRGWANHILHGVALILGPQFREYLRWPTEEIARLHEDANKTQVATTAVPNGLRDGS
ncbi:hypothetical protein CCHL11_08335 [Colletotrichum chlorophyti]|uniref:Uncharacterized protein n=1 Tax=Colletotrichum chlorophyti TaxID=708187 RepID=A0A1Q8RZY6_9PEZI|nr:hypothetical protein CCHL11_08335 [Colletotrichum chlorophyti]